MPCSGPTILEAANAKRLHDRGPRNAFAGGLRFEAGTSWSEHDDELVPVCTFSHFSRTAAREAAVDQHGDIDIIDDREKSPGDTFAGPAQHHPRQGSLLDVSSCPSASLPTHNRHQAQSQLPGSERSLHS